MGNFYKGIFLAAAGFLIGCGSSSSDRAVVISPSDSNAVSSSLTVKLGNIEGIRSSGSLPTKTDTGSEPTVTSVSTTVDVTNGQTAQLQLNVAADSAASALLIKVVGSSDFFTLDVASASKVETDYSIDFAIPENITDGSFCVDSAAIDDANAVSEALRVCFNVESSIDDPTPSPTPTSAPATPTPAPTATPEPASIVGTWTNSSDGAEFLMFTFFEDGTYLHAQIGGDNDDPSGMERGTISRNSSTGVSSVAVTFDNNGAKGISDLDGTSNLRLTVDGNVLTLEADEDGDGSYDGALQFSRETSSGFLGTWTLASGGVEFLMFTFFDDGTYLHAQIDDDNDDPSGMERGTLSRNSSTGVVSNINTTFDNNGSKGLSDFDSASPLRITVNGDVLTLEPDEDGDGTYDASIIFQRN